MAAAEIVGPQVGCGEPPADDQVYVIMLQHLMRRVPGTADLSRMCVAQGLVISVEPLPQLCTAQEHNIQAHHAWCQARGNTLVLLRCSDKLGDCG